MKLQDNHNEFTVRCFAEYMPLRDVVDAFMLEFKHDLPNPPPPPEFTNYQEEVPECEYQFRKNEYIKEKLKEIKSRYFNIYSSVNSSVKFEKEEANYIEKFKLVFEKEWQKEREEKYAEQISEYQVILDNHDMQIRKELSNQLRRLNIMHSQFTEKFRQLFNEAHETFFKSKTDENITNDDITQDDNILQELELMFSHVKNLMFLEKEPKEVLTTIEFEEKLILTNTELWSKKSIALQIVILQTAFLKPKINKIKFERPHFIRRHILVTIEILLHCLFHIHHFKCIHDRN